jgi:hypothetical protein
MTTLKVNFVDDRWEVIHPRTDGDLPLHVEGVAQWIPYGEAGRSAYHLVDDHGFERPIEFINDDWYFLTWGALGYRARRSTRIERGALGLGWWREGDENHPARRTDLSSPRAPEEKESSTSNEEGEESPEALSPTLGRHQRRDSPMPGGYLGLEERILSAQTQEVARLDPGDFGLELPQYGQTPAMTHAAGVEAARERPPSTEPLIAPTALGISTGVNPAFVPGKGKAPAFPSTSTRAPGINPVFVPPRPWSAGGRVRGVLAAQATAPAVIGATAVGGTSGTHAAATVTGATGTGGNGGMRGNPPAVFSGDRSKSDQFLREFRIYKMSNRANSAMRIPIERVGLAMSFIRGPHVDDWAERVLNEIDRLQQGPRALADTDEQLWETFEREFRSAFTDTTKKANAHQKLLQCKMKGDDLDTYVAEFEHWRALAGWGPDDVGTITQFRRGLRDPLHRAILEKTTPRPTTMRGWQDAARTQHELWAEIKSSMSNFQAGAPASNLQRWRQALGKPQASGGQRPGGGGKSQVVPMDVDAVRIDALTPDERQKLLQEGKCFFCRKQGHISKQCPQKEKKSDAPKRGAANGKGTRENQGMTARAAEVKEEEGKTRQEEMAEEIKGMDQSEKDELLDKLILEGF